MSPGRLVRTLLGDRHSRAAGRAYRALFVDLDKAARSIAGEIPANAHLLDVGGGDGEPLNALLDIRADIRVTTIDVVTGVGRWIESRHRSRVTCLDETTLDRYLADGGALPDVLLLCDVLHHVPQSQRDGFLRRITSLVDPSPRLRIVVKDVEPGHWRATLGRLSDHYVTGDRHVRLIGRAELVASMCRARSGLRWEETKLFAVDPPNYAVTFERGD